MNWFNNNFAYRPNTATVNTTTPGSTTIGLGPGSIGLGPGAYGPIGTGTGTTGTGTTGTGSNNGSTTSNNTGWWGNGTGWGNNGSIQVNPDAIGFGFNNGNTGSAGCLPFCGFNNGSTGSTGNNYGYGNSGGWGSNNGNTGWGNRSNESGRYYNYANQRQPYDDFLIRGFNPGYEQCAVVETRNRRRGAEQTIDSIGQVGFWGRGSGYPQNLYYPQNSYNV